MVGPIYIFVAALGGAFLLPLFEKKGRSASLALFFAALAVMTLIPAMRANLMLTRSDVPSEIFTAGFRPPFSINLRMGFEEALLTSSINLLVLMSGIYMTRRLYRSGAAPMMLMLLFAMGLDGIVMTRDVFNLFVFMEITGIASYSLVGMRLDLKGLSAGFKYAIAGSIASIFMLLGIIMLYSSTSTLNLDGILAHPARITGAAAPAIFMLIFSFFIEAKQFPANGWALDVYESSHPAVSAMISAGGSGAVLFAIYKILPLGGPGWYHAAALAGLTTFIAANIMGLKQRNPMRLLGYSSIAQTGLMLAILGLGLAGRLGSSFLLIVSAVFFNHFFAKAGLFWLAGMGDKNPSGLFRGFARKPFLIFLFGIFLLALAGFPPFPGFWGKWSLVMSLASERMYAWIIALLAGSLLEAAYLLRWFGASIRERASADGAGGYEYCFETEGGEDPGFERGEDPGMDGEAAGGGQESPGEAAGYDEEQRAGGAPGEGAASAGKHLPLWIFAFFLLNAGYAYSTRIMPGAWVLYLPIAAAALLLLLGSLPAPLSGVVSIGLVAAYAYRVIPESTGMQLFFNSLFLGGGLVFLLATLHRRKPSAGFYPLVVLMIGSLSGLAMAQTTLEFFFAWEMMTLSSYLLVLRGRKGEGPALSYALFSLGGAFLILAGFAVAHRAVPIYYGIESLSAAGAFSRAVMILLAAGFFVKVAGIGVHLWAPGAYAEAEDDVSPMISGILSKAGVLGFVILFEHTGVSMKDPGVIFSVIGWAGALTAFFGALYASVQEDAKKLLAWSSIGQVGYMVLALAAMSHLGWVAALYLAVNHLLYKGLLFLAIAGVVYRTGTRDMYEMGGLIKKMPLSYISVMMGIIALSGVPPLTGFGGKWLLYNTLVERGWYLQAALGFFSSTVAFLYCFRLVHAIFLGQPKPRFREISEAPLAYLVPQYILIAAIMAVSVFPSILVKPLSSFVAPVFAPTLSWQGSTLVSSLGYWNGTAIMIIVGAIFAITLVFLLLKGPRPQKVKQFNIVYASERPHTPDTTHYAYRFFRPYQDAMGVLFTPLVKRFWGAAVEWTLTVSSALRHVYTGNGQTYALLIFIFGIIVFMISTGGAL